MKIHFLFAIVLCLFCAITVLGQKCTLDDQSLIATFAEEGGPKPYGITSDGLGPYSTTKSRGSSTSVMFQMCNGSRDFVVDLTASTRSVEVLLPGGTALSKFLTFDRVASVPVTADSDAFAAFCGGRNGDGTVILDIPNTATADNYGGCGVDADGFFVRRKALFQLTAGHSLGFQNSPYEAGTLGNGTSYVKVYHPTVNTWSLSGEDTPAAVDPICGIHGSCAALIYQPNNGAAYVKFGVIGRFGVSLSSSRIYP